MIFPDLWFDKEDAVFKDYRVANGKEGEDNHLPCLSRVNIFIGPNNSGKSRFIRHLAIAIDSKKYEASLETSAFTSIDPAVISTKALSESIEDYRTVINEQVVRTKRGQDILKELDKVATRVGRTKLMTNRNIRDEVIHLKNINSNARSKPWGLGNPGTILKANGSRSSVQEIYDAHIEAAIQQVLNDIKNWKFRLSYTPALRTLRNFKEHPIQEKFWADHFEGKLKNGSKQSILFTGESLYDNIQSNLLGLIHQIEAHIQFSHFIGDTFYNGQKVSITAPINKKDKSQTNIMVKIGADDELPITELGDGVQAIIGLTYQLYTRADQSHYLFIDEPEQNLHPGFQRIFMETLLQDRFKDTQIFICTHSNHFLDMSLDYPDDIFIYSFQKKTDHEDKKKSFFEIKYRSGRDKEVLQMIGARNSSVFLSNCTLWVEGITDRLYIRAWLDIYQELMQLKDPNNKKYHEDLHFSFIEFAGSNITHWSFLDEEEDTLERGTENEKQDSRINIEAICGPVLVVADEDGSGAESKSGKNDEDLKEKAKRHRLLRKNLEENYLMLERKEMENMLLPNQLINGVNDTYKANEYSFSEFEFADYQDEPIAKFLTEKIREDKKPAIATKSSGTFESKKKKEVCRAVVDALKIEISKEKSKDELIALLLPKGKTEDANTLDTPYQLAKRVYEFIKEHNS